MPVFLSRPFKLQSPYPVIAAILAGLLFTRVVVNSVLHKEQAALTFNVQPVSQTPQIAADFSQLSSWHLFGETQTAFATDASTDAPAELKLRGVFYLSGTKARAIIETAGQTQKTYQSNDTLEGGSIVQTISADKVTLLINNQLSTLPLSRPEPASAEAEPTP